MSPSGAPQGRFRYASSMLLRFAMEHCPLTAAAGKPPRRLPRPATHMPDSEMKAIPIIIAKNF